MGSKQWNIRLRRTYEGRVTIALPDLSPPAYRAKPLSPTCPLTALSCLTRLRLLLSRAMLRGSLLPENVGSRRCCALVSRCCQPVFHPLWWWGCVPHHRCRRHLCRICHRQWRRHWQSFGRLRRRNRSVLLQALGRRPCTWSMLAAAPCAGALLVLVVGRRKDGRAHATAPGRARVIVSSRPFPAGRDCTCGARDCLSSGSSQQLFGIPFVHFACQCVFPSACASLSGDLQMDKQH